MSPDLFHMCMINNVSAEIEHPQVLFSSIHVQIQVENYFKQEHARVFFGKTSTSSINLFMFIWWPNQTQLNLIDKAYETHSAIRKDVFGG